MKRVEVLSKSQVPFAVLLQDGDSLVVDVESKEYLNPCVSKHSPSSAPARSVLSSDRSSRRFFGQDKNLSKIRALIKKVKVKEAVCRKDISDVSSMNFSLSKELERAKDDGAVFYNKFFVGVGLDIFSKRSTKIKRRENDFLLKIYRDADSQNIDVLLARLFVGALGLRRGLKVRIVL